MSAVQVFENTVRKGEIAPIEQFSFSYIVFYPSIELTTIFIKNKIVVCKLFHSFPKQALVSTCQQCRFFENTVGKGEIPWEGEITWEG